MVYSGDSFYEQYLQHNGMNKNADLDYIDVEPGTVVHFKYIRKEFKNGKWRYYYKSLSPIKEFIDTRITGEATRQNRMEILRDIDENRAGLDKRIKENNGTSSTDIVNTYKREKQLKEDLRQLDRLSILEPTIPKQLSDFASDTIKRAKDKINSILSKFKKK